MRKNRGLGELDSYLENFSGLIKNKLKYQKKVKILDAGCGYGLAMTGLLKKFGNRIEVIGYNKNKQHGTIKDLKRMSIKRGLFTKEDIKKIKNFPKIIYLNAEKNSLSEKKALISSTVFIQYIYTKIKLNSLKK